MFFRRKVTDYHQPIIDHMIAAHYPDVYGGVCFGIAAMGLQAILLRDTATYDKRIEELASLPIMLEHTNEGLRSVLDNSYRPFLDGVSTYQSPFRHTELFDRNVKLFKQKIQISAPLVMPNALEKIGGIAAAGEFCGIYNKQELSATFKSLRLTLLKQKLKSPAGLLLASNNHALMLGFDPAIKKWILIESNNGPSEQLTDDQAAKKIISIFSGNKYAAFQTLIYTTGNHQKEVMQSVNKWKESAEYHTNHTINEKRATELTSSGCSLLYIAAQNGNAELVRELIKHGADVNLSTPEVPPALYIAACFGYLNVAKELLQHGAYVKPDYYTGVSPLIVAASNKHIDIVKLLRDHGADLFEIIHNKEVMKMLQNLREEDRRVYQSPAMS